MSRSLHLTTGGARTRDLAAVRMHPAFRGDSQTVAPLDAPETMPAGACDSTSTRAGSPLRAVGAPSEVRRDFSDVYARALADAMPLLDAVGQRSALKQAGADWGIPWGTPMGEFVTWAEAQLVGGR
jgi:hypothetical protein